MVRSVAVSQRFLGQQASRPEVAAVTVPDIATVSVIPEVIKRDDPKRPDCRQRSGLGSVQEVLPASKRDDLTFLAAWQR
jgi:hypothetical protein